MVIIKILTKKEIKERLIELNNNTDHAFLSPSTSNRWLNCPPSARLEEEYDTHQSNSYAFEGTMAHECAELFFEHKKGKMDYISFVNLTKNRYTSDQEEAAIDYVYYVLDIADTKNILVEYKINLENYIPEGFGTTDSVLIDKDTLHIIDFKYGKYKIDSVFNTQLMIYALGVLDTYKFKEKPKTVMLHIYQPRINNRSVFELPTDILLDWGEKTLKPNAEMAFKGKGEFNKGKWCKFCKAKEHCKVYYSAL